MGVLLCFILWGVFLLFLWNFLGGGFVGLWSFFCIFGVGSLFVVFCLKGRFFGFVFGYFFLLEGYAESTDAHFVTDLE